MFSRLFSVPLLLGAAVGGPYLVANGPNIDGLFATSTEKSTNSQPSDAHAAALLPVPPVQARPIPPQGPGAVLYPTETLLEGQPAISLHEVFNLNITKEWVYQRWARKSTALSELGLFGIRVPLVTGTQLHDLAGSLTYFFAKDGRVSRISFHGITGDTTQLVMLAARQYGLQQQKTVVAGEQLFQVRRKDLVFSELRTRPAPVLWASSPHDSFTVDFDLQRPGASTPLPSRLPPLPIVKRPLPQPVEAKASQPVVHETASSSSKKEPVDLSEKWNPFFPRSRVPAKQVDGLDRSGRLW